MGRVDLHQFLRVQVNLNCTNKFTSPRWALGSSAPCSSRRGEHGDLQRSVVRGCEINLLPTYSKEDFRERIREEKMKRGNGGDEGSGGGLVSISQEQNFTMQH